MADVNPQLRSWSVTPGANSPTTSTVVGAGLSGNLQQIQATTRQYLASIGSSVVCSATTDLSTVDGYTIPLSGNSTVTSFGTEQAGICYQLQFSGTPILKNSTAIQTPTPTSGDISVASGDIISVVSQGSGNWKVFSRLQQNPHYNSLNASVITGTANIQTPILDSGASDPLQLWGNGTRYWNIIKASSPGQLYPQNDNAQLLGGPSNRINSAYIGAEIFLGNASVVSGIGIAFPSTQSASTDVNTLDDYEEGTWTPSVGGTATYTLQSGRYTKVGRKVHVECNLTINAIGTGSTSQITGLPFAPGLHSGLYVTNVSNAAANFIFVVGSIASGTTTIGMQGNSAAATATTTLAIIGNATVIQMAGEYSV